MKPARLFGVFLLCCFSVLSLSSRRLLAGLERTGRHEVAPSMMLQMGQAKANSSPAGNQQANLYKEVIAHKGAIKWRPAPPPGIPTDVCVVFKACANDKTGPKLVTLPPATEAGQPVGRGLLLSTSQDPQHPDAVILERQTVSELYFFLLSPEGTLARTAYAQQGSKSWTTVANALAQPVFDKDLKDWLDWVAKLGK
jgi:hypothetical protein